MKNASLLIFPSTWYEGMPLTVIEALACGTPVVASNLGAMSEMIRHGDNGLHFRSGDPADLAGAVKWAANRTGHLEIMRKRARADFELKYSTSENYDRLLAVYRAAIGRRHSSSLAA
jgi:glycosyltransferase involved in cell wall biosynthesis